MFPMKPTCSSCVVPTAYLGRKLTSQALVMRPCNALGFKLVRNRVLMGPVLASEPKAPSNTEAPQHCTAACHDCVCVPAPLPAGQWRQGSTLLLHRVELCPGRPGCSQQPLHVLQQPACCRPPASF